MFGHSISTETFEAVGQVKIHLSAGARNISEFGERCTFCSHPPSANFQGVVHLLLNIIAGSECPIASFSHNLLTILKNLNFPNHQKQLKLNFANKNRPFWSNCHGYHHISHHLNYYHQENWHRYQLRQELF